MAESDQPLPATYLESSHLSAVVCEAFGEAGLQSDPWLLEWSLAATGDVHE
jgi:hypothetical protein